MARRKSNDIEQVELKPQVIGFTYRKKSNFGRVIFIFIVLAVAIYFINDISVFVNDLFNKKTGESIKQLADEEDSIFDKIKDKEADKDKDKEEEVYYSISDTLEIKLDGVVLNNFKYENNTLSFVVNNNNNQDINLSSHKYYLELFNNNKTLLNRFKLDINNVSAGSKTNYSFNVDNAFNYLTIEEKKVTDYPNVELTEDEYKMATLTCTNNQDVIEYTFSDYELVKIKHRIDENTNNSNYISDYANYKDKVSKLSSIEGVNANFIEINNGFNVTIDIDLGTLKQKLNDEKYYYNYKEQAKIISFEMQTYGFKCA